MGRGKGNQSLQKALGEGKGREGGGEGEGEALGCHIASLVLPACADFPITWEVRPVLLLNKSNVSSGIKQVFTYTHYYPNLDKGDWQYRVMSEKRNIDLFHNPREGDRREIVLLRKNRDLEGVFGCS